ncbi:hypothetical protein K439DRAFT_1614940 [Ramaria rubella]|nr:hypothetical protein K439DRAFT_1614940 [Ramaria rubella]
MSAKQARHTNEDHAHNNDELAYQQVEQQEMDDDLDATLEQEELKQESGTWLGKCKRTNQIKSEAEDDDNPLFPNLFEDIDDLYVSDSNEFQSGPPEPVVSSLPKRRRTTGTFSSPSLAQSSSNFSATPSNASNAPPPPALPFTPWKQKDKTGKAAMNQHSPQSASIWHVATSIFHIFLATTDGTFAPDNEMTKEIKASFLTACDELEAPRQILRFQNKIKQRIAQLRGEVVKDAWALILGHAGFGLSLSLPTEDLRAYVKFLLSYGRHHLGMWKMQRAQPFANNIHAAIIGRRFFHGRPGLYAPQFNPIPLPLLPLVITAVRHAIIIGIFPLTSAAHQVECVLRDWDTGENQMWTNHFQHKEYGPVYARHISNLRKYKTECPGAFRKLQERTWAAAWSVSYPFPHDCV